MQALDLQRTLCDLCIWQLSWIEFCKITLKISEHWLKIQLEMLEIIVAVKYVYVIIFVI